MALTAEMHHSEMRFLLEAYKSISLKILVEGALMISTTPRESSPRLRSGLGEEERILILGATGWFGRTLTEMLIGCPQEVMYVASYPRVINLEKTSINVFAYDFELIRDFRPTMVVDFAFLTREKVAQFGQADFLRVNEELTLRLLEVAALPSIKKILFTSSGAAVHQRSARPKTYEQDPYGFLKYRLEKTMEDFASRSGKSTLCLRPWSVSGHLVGRPLDYAFSSFIIQALGGGIKIKARQPVFRRYCALDDLLAVGFELLHNFDGNSYRLLESGGELCDLVNLAERVVNLVGNGATIEHSVDPEAEPDSYYSDNVSWSESCNNAKYASKDLETQIIQAIDSFR